MRRFAFVFSGLALLVLAAADSSAARFTAFLDPVETALQARVADDATPSSLKKLFGKHLKKLAKESTTLAKDVSTAKVVLPSIEKKAGADTALLALAETSLDGLATAVSDQLAAAEQAADSLRAKKDPLVKIDSLLLKARTSIQLAQGGGAFLARMKAMQTALKNTSKANSAVVKALSGGGGGGGGGVCGPAPKPSGLRALGGGESFSVHIVDFSPRTFDFVGGSVVAKVGPAFGNSGNPNTLTVEAFDCTKQAVVFISIPYPPVIDQQYRNGQGGTLGVDAGYQFQWDGLTEVFPSGVSVKATAFNQATKTITLEFSVGTQITAGLAVIRGWTGP